MAHVSLTEISDKALILKKLTFKLKSVTVL